MGGISFKFTSQPAIYASIGTNFASDNVTAVDGTGEHKAAYISCSVARSPWYLPCGTTVNPAIRASEVIQH